MEFEIRLIRTTAEKNAVVRARRHAYSDPKKYVLTPGFSFWTTFDEIYPVFGIFCGRELAASFRLDYLKTRHAMALHSWPVYKSRAPGPAVVVSASCVIDKYRGRGFSHSFRMFAIATARRWGAKTFFSILTRKDVRLKTYRKYSDKVVGVGAHSLGKVHAIGGTACVLTDLRNEISPMELLLAGVAPPVKIDGSARGVEKPRAVSPKALRYMLGVDLGFGPGIIKRARG